MMANKTRSLQEVVGENTYTVWTDMLRRLVPGGRTHRIAPLLASMLHYAAMVALEQPKSEFEENSVGQSLLLVSELQNFDRVISEIGDVTEQLFYDADVPFERVNAKGERYSILEQTWYDFISWYDMPWES